MDLSLPRVLPPSAPQGVRGRTKAERREAGRRRAGVFTLVQTRPDTPTLTCRLCRLEFNRITPSHLFYRHRVTLDTYRRRFPGAPLTSREMRKDMSRYISSHWGRLGRGWTPQLIRKLLQEAAREGHPLHVKAVMAGRQRLYSAALRHFGSWDRALRFADLDPTAIRRRQKWTPTRVLSELRKARLSGSLPQRADLRHAAGTMFGSWRHALLEAGLEALRAPSIRWTRRSVLSEIRSRARMGRSLQASFVHDRATGLWRAARRLFRRPWAEIVRAAGIPYSSPRRWDPRSVLKAVRSGSP